MLQPRVPLEYGVWIVVVYLVVLVIGGTAIALVLGRRGIGVRRQRWWMAPSLGLGMGFLVWLIGFGWRFSLAMFAVAFVITFLAAGAVTTTQEAADRARRRG